MSLNQRYVDPQNGADPNDGLTPATAWRTIPKAVLDAPTNCDIFGAPGEYLQAATLTIDDGGTGKTDRHFIADQGDAQIVGSVFARALVHLRTSAAPLSIEGFEIIATKGGESAGLEMEGGTSAIDCLVFNTGTAGIFTGDLGAATAYITRCVATGEAPLGNVSLVSGAALRMATWSEFDLVVDRTTLIHLSNTGAGGEACAIGVGGVFTSNLITLTVTNSILGTRATGAASSIIYTMNATDWDTPEKFKARWAGDHNVFFKSMGPTANILALNSGFSLYPTIETFQAVVAPDDANSIDADPLFVDVGVGRRHFGLRTGSPALTASATGGPCGPFGESVGFLFDAGAHPNSWSGQQSNWTFTGAGTGFVSVPANMAVERKLAGENEALISLLGVIPVGKRAKRIRVRATETVVAGDTSQILDTTDYSAGNPDARTIGYEENDGIATGAYSDETIGRAFTGTAGSNVHLRFIFRDNGRRRSA